MRPGPEEALESKLRALKLPLAYVWPATSPAAFLVFVTGEGGWASLDRAVARVLARDRVAVIALSSLRYFWRGKAPARVAADLGSIVSTVAARGKPVFLGGYSFGAQVVPVVLPEWTGSERGDIAGLVLIAPDKSASFKVSLLDWIRRPRENPATRVSPAVRELGLPTLCVAGQSEVSDTACGELSNAATATLVTLPGGHHFNGDYERVGKAVSGFLSSRIAARQSKGSVGR